MNDIPTGVTIECKNCGHKGEMELLLDSPILTTISRLTALVESADRLSDAAKKFVDEMEPDYIEGDSTAFGLRASMQTYQSLRKEQGK